MDQLRALLQQLSLRQRLIIVVAACAVAGGLFFGLRWNKERDMRPLFSNLAAEDAGAVVERLKTGNVDYRVAENGSILVPSARVAELRLELASAGVPKSGRLGFELFDKQNFGASEFDEQVRFRRAIEGELERSVVTIAGVEGARVHVSFAKDSVFSDLRQPAKASVLLRLRAGTRLTAQHVSAIEHLAASAVEGLQPEAVTVVDMNGNLLGKPRSSLDGDAGASSASIEYRQSLERDLLVKIRSTLDPLLGSEKYRAGVTVECDFTSGDQSEESFDPDRSVMLTTQRTEDASGSTSTGGVPGTASNLPRPLPPSGGGRGSVSRKTENITFQNTRVVRHIKLPQGALKRVSVAILVDQALHWEGSGAAAKPILEPPSADKLRVVKDVVSGVVGCRPDRGDQILVETLPFDTTLALTAPPPGSAPAPRPPDGITLSPDALMRSLRSIPPLWLGAGACLVLVTLVACGLVIRSLLKGKRGTASASSTAALPPGAPGHVAALAAPSKDEFEAKAIARLNENRQLQESAENAALDQLKVVPTTRKAEVFRKFIVEEAKSDPGRVAQLLRSWLDGEHT